MLGVQGLVRVFVTFLELMGVCRGFPRAGLYGDRSGVERSYRFLLGSIAFLSAEPLFG